MTNTAADSSMVPLLIAIAIIVALAGIVLFWIRLKSRPIPAPTPGTHNFRASRLSRGNRLLPAQVAISPTSITLYKPQWVGKLEESVHLSHVASIKIDTNLIFSDVLIETSGGHNPLACHGHTKGDAVKIKKLIEDYQSAFYKAKT